METIEVLFDLGNSRKIYKKYLDFERKREFKKVPGLLIFGISVVLVSIGLYFKLGLFLILGLITLGLISVFIIYFLIRFQIAYYRFSKALEESANDFEHEFTFSYDSNDIIFESKNATQKLNWVLIENYQENDRDLYLFYKNRRLYNIISESIIGENNYKKFKKLLITKIPTPTV